MTTNLLIQKLEVEKIEVPYANNWNPAIDRCISIIRALEAEQPDALHMCDEKSININKLPEKHSRMNDTLNDIRQTALKFAQEIMGWKYAVDSSTWAEIHIWNGLYDESSKGFTASCLDEVLIEAYRWIDSFGNDEDGDCKLFLDMSRRALDGKINYCAIIHTKNENFRIFTKDFLQKAIMQACLKASARLKEIKI